MAIKKVVPKRAYLTKRIIKSAVNHALKDASVSSMKVMGYVVKQQNGWVVKESASGMITRISKIAKTPRSGEINLD